MSRLERTKDVYIDEQKYQIEKFSAKIGMWIATQVFTKIAPLGLDQQIDIKNMPDSRQIMSEQEFSDLVDYCMCASKKYENVGNGQEHPLPIMIKKGVWLFPELEYDLTTVVALCAQVLSFNIASFFTEKSLKTLGESLKDIPLFHTQL